MEWCVTSVTCASVCVDIKLLCYCFVCIMLVHMGGCEGVWCSWYMTRITISTGVPHTWVINMQGDAWQLVDVRADRTLTQMCSSFQQRCASIYTQCLLG